MSSYPSNAWMRDFTTATGLMTSVVMSAAHQEDFSQDKLNLFTRKLLRRLRRAQGDKKAEITWGTAVLVAEATLRLMLKELKGASHDPR